jgi:hypothetical protein
MAIHGCLGRSYSNNFQDIEPESNPTVFALVSPLFLSLSFDEKEKRSKAATLHILSSLLHRRRHRR